MKRKLLITCRWALFGIGVVLVLNTLSLLGAIIAIFIVRPFLDYDPDYEIVILYVQIAAASAIAVCVLNPLYVRVKTKINLLVGKS